MEHTLSLTHITLVVVAALAGGLGFARFKQPPILGYILAGVLLGPSGIALIQSREEVSLLAEFGVLLLLFVIGMELSLRSFKKVWLVSTLCVVLQIALSLGVTFLLSHLFGWGNGLTVLLGFVIALSSTAVVVKMLETVGELRSETGQVTIGVLIAQDLAIVPMILILRNFDKSWFDPMLIIKLFGSMGFIVALILYLSRKERVKIPFIHIIAGEKDLTPLACLAMCFGAAAISGLIGLSAAYGAFLAGFFLGNTHERVLMLETTKPIQSILMMAFFLSIGLLLDIKFLINNVFVVLILLVFITVGKTALNIGILHLLKRPWSQAFLSGVVLAQLGEFAFLLTTVGYEAGLINHFGESLIISLTVLSLTFSPVWLTTAKRLKAIADANRLGLRPILSTVCGSEVKTVLCFFKDLFRKNKSPQLPITKQIEKPSFSDETSQLEEAPEKPTP